MTVVWILTQCLISVLTVIGLMLLWRLIFSAFFAPASISSVVLVTTIAEAENLDLLLDEASGTVFRRRSVPTVVLIAPNLMRGVMGEGSVLHEEYRELIEARGAVAYMICELKQPSSE